jgi:hypothetical protein
MTDLTGIATATNAVGSVVNGLMDRLWPTPEQKSSAEARLMKAELEAAMAPIQAQLEVAKLEAVSPHWFVAGARPAIVWVGALSLFAFYGIGSLVGIGLWAYACFKSDTLIPRPDMGVSELLGLITPMLGVSLLRSHEKINGVATSSIGR